MQTWIQLALQSRRDDDRDEADLRARDRAIGASMADGLEDRARVTEWLAAVLGDEELERVRNIEAVLRGVRMTLLLLGLVGGAGAAAAIYSYDGSRPINILPAIAVFVILPLGMLVPTLVSMLPSSWLVATPAIADLQASLLAFAQGPRMMMLRVLSAKKRRDLEAVFGESRSHQRVFGDIHKWELLSSAQHLAVAFHLGAITWLTVRVFVTDLSFTWSATAQAVTATRVHRFADILARPWSGLWTDAVPTLADVEATQYFRLGEGTVGSLPTDAIDPSMLAHWWTFLLASMIVYGLLPRVLTAAISVVRRRAAVRATLLHAPAAQAALRRMRVSTIETRATTREPTSTAGAADSDSRDQVMPNAPTAIAVVWAYPDVDQSALIATIESTFDARVLEPLHHGGGARSIEDDVQTQAQLVAAMKQAVDPVIVLAVKAWEPATLDAVDFVTSLRALIGPSATIIVGAIDLEPGSTPTDVDQWRHRMNALGDPFLRTVRLGEGGAR